MHTYIYIYMYMHAYAFGIHRRIWGYQQEDVSRAGVAANCDGGWWVGGWEPLSALNTSFKRSAYPDICTVFSGIDLVTSPPRIWKPR